MSAFREVVTIFVGQAGTQASNACWELLCKEHGIQLDGFGKQSSLFNLDNSYCAVFAPLQGERFTPRTVIVDLEPTIIDEIRSSIFRDLFNPYSLIAGREDAANNFARGYYSIGRELIDITLERIRVICENCSNLNAFIVFRSLSGGTGSGFATLLFEHLKEDYDKKLKFDFAVYPAPNISTVIVEPYNSVLATHGTMEYEDCCFPVDNEALHDICVKKLEISRPTFTNLNHLQAQIFSNITAPMRFEGVENLRLQELLTNLIPYPRIHFPLMSYAPIMNPKKGSYSTSKIEDITLESFERTNQMVICDPSVGAYMSCCLLYRGGIKAKNVQHTLASLKKKEFIRFVPWSPTGFKMGVMYQPPTTISGDLAQSPQTVTNLSNNTTIRHSWCKLARKFDLMYKKKAFFHHYLTEGMEENVFNDARTNISALLEDYIEIET